MNLRHLYSNLSTAIVKRLFILSTLGIANQSAWGLVLSSIRKERDMSIAVSGIDFTVTTDEYWTFKEIFIDGEYSLALRHTAYFRPTFIVDLGANVGHSVIFFKSRFPSAPIYAFEPLTIQYDRLKKNLAGVTGVTLFKNSAGPDARLVQFVSNGVGSSSVIDHSSGNTKKHECSQIDIFEFVRGLEHGGQGLLKVDIEGGEWEIFDDQRLFELLERFGVVIIEVHEFSDNTVRVFDAKHMDPLRGKGWHVTLVRRIPNWASVYVLCRS